MRAYWVFPGMRKSPFRYAKEPFPMTGRDVPEERKSPFGMFWMPPLS